MANSLAGLYLLLVTFAILFQIALILGAPWGHLTQGRTQKGPLPRQNRTGAALSIVILALMGAAILSAVGRWPGWPVWTGWLAMAMSGVSMLLNWISPSEAERQLWGPVTTLMFLLALGVMIY
jgi:hypothetical protein